MEEDKMSTDISPKDKAMLQIHDLLLQALRHREQDVLRFLAILGPALAGIVFLHSTKIMTENGDEYVLGMYAILGLLAISCAYTVALGYNYRSLTMQLAKLESEKYLGIDAAILNAWPRKSETFITRYRILKFLPWCHPPGNINIFYWASVGAIVALIVIGFETTPHPESLSQAWDYFNLISIIGLLFSLYHPARAGWKLRSAAKMEKEW